MGGLSVAEKKNKISEKLTNIYLTIEGLPQSEDHYKGIIIKQLSEDEKNYLEDQKIKNYFDEISSKFYKKLKEGNEEKQNIRSSINIVLDNIKKSEEKFENLKSSISEENSQKQEEYNKKLRELPKELGYLQTPAHFRSTKHFTVNTPLGYTHSYNQVESNRKYIIIDSSQIFLDSPYHYSIAYHDAYLDVTHEFFPISEQAIVLMSEEHYNSCLKDTDLQEALSKRRVIVFQGEESLAINMVLASLGALPSRPGNPYMEYDEETQQILENSIQELAFHHHILYDQSHGNLNFKGGHFSDLYDGYHKGMLHFEEEVLDFLKQKYTSYPNFFQYHTFREFIKSGAYHSLITKVGWKSIVQTFEEYNKLALYRFKNERQAYIQERNSITPEQHEVFVKTLEFIKEYYASSEYFDFKTQSYLQSLMIPFFHSYDIQSQLDASYALLSFQEDQKRNHR